MVEGRVVPAEKVFDEIEARHAHDHLSRTRNYAGRH